jgi:hypothetical protein
MMQSHCGNRVLYGGTVIHFGRCLIDSDIEGWLTTLGKVLVGEERVKAMLAGQGVSLILKSANVTLNVRRPVTFPDTVRFPSAEVDVKGGWKIGDPYVVSRSLTFYLHNDSVECSTLHQRKLSRQSKQLLRGSKRPPSLPRSFFSSSNAARRMIPILSCSLYTCA